MSSVILLSNRVSSVKNQYIGDCHYYDDIVGRCNLTLVCVETPRNTTLLNGNVKSICRNQHEYHRYDDGFSKYWIGTIHFENCEGLQIPRNLLQVYDRVHTLNMSYIGTESLKSGNFNGAKRLIKLIASHNNLVEIPANLFNQSDNLTDIDFSFNKITQFDSDALPLINHVTTLNLSFNNISEFNVNTFQKLIELKRLLLSNNQIADVPSFLFHKTERLNEVDFSFNKIKNVDKFAFSGDLNLKKLNFSHNQLTILHPKIGETLTNLTHLDISWNQITSSTSDSFQRLESLTYLDLSGNSIKSLNAQSFGGLVKLQQLILSQNSLVEIASDTFSTLRSLQILDLTNNLLKTLNVNIFAATPNQLKIVDIANNRLRELNGFTKESVPNVKIVGIDQNLFNCSYLEELFQSITWKHLDSISKRINCSTTVEMDDINDGDFQSAGCLIDGTAMKSTHLIALTWFNAICLIGLGVLLAGLFLRKHLSNRYHFIDVFYRRKGAETLTNDIEIGE